MPRAASSSRRMAASQAAGSRSARTRRTPAIWAALGGRVDPLQGGLRGRAVLVHEPVDSHDDLVATLDGLLDPVRRLLDLALLEAALERRQRAAERLDLVEVGPRGALDLVGQALDEVRAGERVGRLGDPALVGQDLLGAQGQPGGLGGRQGEGLVARVRVQALGAAEHGRQGLDRGPDHVVVDRLGGQARAGGLDVHPADHRTDVR